MRPPDVLTSFATFGVRDGVQKCTSRCVMDAHLHTRLRPRAWRRRECRNLSMWFHVRWTAEQLHGQSVSYDNKCLICARRQRPWSRSLPSAKYCAKLVLADLLNGIYSLASDAAATRRRRNTKMHGIDDA